MAERGRTLWVELIPKEKLAATFSGEGAAQLSMGGFLQRSVPAGRREKIVSHTFQPLGDDSAVLTLLFEREVEGA